ncbi:MAG: prenyltransferase [Candidatus Cloacimonetes bacterium HGW-Cloacimonetes-3]|nr:MAG: prenyltransferase [Candidatus Cloacimonetes bacterium HGW-Cloacimonetes-3]
MGQMFALTKFAPLGKAISGFLSVFFISASILAMNDYFDVESDKINAPKRPIPSGQVAPLEALVFSLFLLFAGLGLSWLLGPTVLLISSCLAIIGFLYNRYLKKTGLPGNLLVSISVGTTFVYGGASVGLPFHKTVILFGLIAALIDLGEEIAADAMDMKGDKLIHSNSLAIKYGRAIALRVSTVIFGLVILLTWIPFLMRWFSLFYLIPILVIDISIITSSVKLLSSANDEGRKYIRRLYIGATLGLLLFLLMRLAGI